MTTHMSEHMSAQMEDCAICFESLFCSSGEETRAKQKTSVKSTRTIECQHTFHTECLRVWERRAHAQRMERATCPLCRVPFGVFVPVYRFQPPRTPFLLTGWSCILVIIHMLAVVSVGILCEIRGMQYVLDAVLVYNFGFVFAYVRAIYGVRRDRWFIFSSNYDDEDEFYQAFYS